MSTTLEFNIAKVQQRIVKAAKKYQRQPQSVQLLAVSKMQSADAIRKAAAAGITAVGESYLQEALDKINVLSDLKLCWHFIGPIQSNKTRAIAEHFDWVHSVDRLKIAQRLNQQRPEQLAPLNICLQVNISGEETKAGISLEQLEPLARQVAALPQLNLRGLMVIPQANENYDQQREVFSQLAAVAAQLKAQHPQLDTLSMGMSTDLEAAIAAGSTIVRIGTDIFGPRN
jgi:pyridoxal phosphate enzyme (YggS family)